MTTLHKIYLLSFFVLTTNTLLSQQSFPCSDPNGKYTVVLLNPNAQDGDDGNVDGNCLYRFITEATTSLNAIDFTYVGTGSASPISVTHKVSPVLVQGVINVKSPCGNLDVAFDVSTLTGSPLCAIRNAVMPVELVDFQVIAVEKGIRLNWTTASEANNSGFDIERSTNGKIWKKLDFVAGNLTTLSTQHYEFMDEQPYEGQSYYRLKQIDVDGAFEYSEVIAASYNNDKSEFTVFPNPAKEELTLSFVEELEYMTAEVSIFNNLGQVVKQESLVSKNLSINDLSSGIHLLVVKLNKQIYTMIFVKE